MDSILTDEHKELINKKVKKAINDLDFNKIVSNYIEKEFYGLWDDCDVRHTLQDMVTEIIKQHLVKSGLLQDK